MCVSSKNYPYIQKVNPFWPMFTFTQKKIYVKCSTGFLIRIWSYKRFELKGNTFSNTSKTIVECTIVYHSLDYFNEKSEFG